jgi:hypothetical protein
MVGAGYVNMYLSDLYEIAFFSIQKKTYFGAFYSPH